MFTREGESKCLFMNRTDYNTTNVSSVGSNARHDTGANEKWRVHYTEEIADIVKLWAKEEFEYLNYSTKLYY